MDLKVISELVRMMNDSKLSSMEVESKEIRIKLEKNINNGVKDNASVNTYAEENKKFNFKPEGELKPVIENAADKTSEKTVEVPAEENTQVIKSPIVGTFYSSPSPDKEPFAVVGKKVKKGDVLCIIEAMKLMNEIESEFDGEITEILVENGSMVEYGQPLLRIK